MAIILRKFTNPFSINFPFQLSMISFLQNRRKSESENEKIEVKCSMLTYLSHVKLGAIKFLLLMLYKKEKFLIAL